MNSLLQWAIANSDTSAAPSNPPDRKISDLDPAIIDHILGKPDAVRMKEALDIAIDESQPESTRVAALDDFEMLIESLDNANDMEALKMWQPILSLVPSPSNAIRMNALWILGTAVQNNTKSQLALLEYEPFHTVLHALTDKKSDSPTRSKAIYVISGLLKHNRLGVQRFESADGWDSLKTALGDSDISVRRKTAFLLSSLLLADAADPPASSPSSTPSAPSTAVTVSSPFQTSDLAFRAMTSHRLVDALLSSIISPVPFGPDAEHDGPDVDYEEKVLRAIVNYVNVGTPAKEVKDDINKLLEIGWETKRGDSWNLDQEDWQVLKNTAASS
ncbi:hsp70 nucleotide exchange factor fes1 [Tulasnella sp. 419]|nr:hsp70 nucleotide exchange factor fes1 [Tulasnella sp. 419]